MSYSPATGLVYVPALDGGFMYVPADPRSFQRRAGVFWNNGLHAGGALYRSYCTRCHGHATVAGGVVTDLRYSAMLGSPEAYRAVVLDGVLMRNGMISFSDFLKPDDVEAIRAYVIEQAHREQKRLSQ